MAKPMADVESDGFACWRSGSWAEAVGLANAMQGWIFRGQSDYEWGLVTGIERAAERYGYPRDGIPDVEKYQVSEFRRQAHQYLTHLPDPGRKLEWLALIQHHGGPTRLLDFTASFYVAAFFAVENAARDRDAAVWAVDLTLLREAALKIGGVKHDVNVFRDACDVERRLVEDCLEKDTGVPGIIHVQPWTLSERIVIQQGVFLCPTSFHSDFQQNLAASLRIPADVFEDMPEANVMPCPSQTQPQCRLVKIILPHALHGEILADLRRMNITAATLFPGLDGFARSLQYPLTLFSGWGETDSD